MQLNLPAGKTIDVALWHLEHNTAHKGYNPTGQRPAALEFTDFLQAGDIVDLRELYADLFQELKAAGNPYSSETSYFWNVYLVGEDHSRYNLGANVSYDPAYPNKLNINFTGSPGRTVSIDYGRASSAPSEQLCFGFTTTFSPSDMDMTESFIAVWVNSNGYALYNGPGNARLAMNMDEPQNAVLQTGEPGESASNFLSWYLIESPDRAPNYFYLYTDYLSGPDFQIAYVNSPENTPDDLESDPKPDDDFNDDNHGHPKPQVSQYIPNDGLPKTSALAAGFIKAYHLSSSQAQALSDFMLTDSFLNAVKKLNLNPMDYIVGFHLIPVYASSTEAATIYIGGVDSEVGGAKITNEYVQFDCGSVDTTEMYGSFADYEPQTKCSIYLPFCGIKQLKTDDVMRARLTLTYRINVLSGAFTASLRCDTSRKLNAEIYYWTGNMSFSVPITNNDYSSKYMAMASMVVGGAQMLSGNPSGAGQAVSSMIDVVTAKPQLSRASSLSADAGMMSNYTPFLIVERPEQAIPQNYNQLNGRVSQIGGTVSKFSGYTEFSSVDLSGIPCTDSERDEILSLLKGGVFV